jgi:hypothetical protein
MTSPWWSGGGDVKRPKFEREKAKYEKRKKRRLTDDEFDQILRKRMAVAWVGEVLAFAVGAAMIAEWPGPWLGPLTIYVGWAIAILLLIDLLRNLFAREGLFYRLDL